MKQCQGCGEQKPFTEFHRMEKSPDGYRPRCKVCRKAETTEWYVANRATIKARTKKWQQDNPERYRAQLRSWGQRNHEYKRQKNREYHLLNREARIKQQAQYQKEHPEKARTQNARRRAQIGAEIHHITKDEWQTLKDDYAGCCAYCHRKCAKPTMDHVVPLKLGGRHTVDNIVPACGKCNRAKGTRSVVAFLAGRSHLEE